MPATHALKKSQSSSVSDCNAMNGRSESPKTTIRQHRKCGYGARADGEAINGGGETRAVKGKNYMQIEKQDGIDPP